MSEHSGAAPHVVKLELPARPDVVAVARLVMGALAATDPLFDEERTADLRLAVSEAFTNAIQAEIRALGPSGAAGSSIVVHCTLAVGRIEVAVTDHGGGFDPDSLEAHPDVTDPARLDYEGGLGIPLIKMLADDVRFEPTEHGMTLAMGFEPRLPETLPPMQ